MNVCQTERILLKNLSCLYIYEHERLKGRRVTSSEDKDNSIPVARANIKYISNKKLRKNNIPLICVETPNNNHQFYFFYFFINTKIHFTKKHNFWKGRLTT